jgi:hypothetical protein
VLHSRVFDRGVVNLVLCYLQQPPWGFAVMPEAAATLDAFGQAAPSAGSVSRHEDTERRHPASEPDALTRAGTARVAEPRRVARFSL